MRSRLGTVVLAILLLGFSSGCSSPRNEQAGTAPTPAAPVPTAIAAENSMPSPAPSPLLPPIADNLVTPAAPSSNTSPQGQEIYESALDRAASAASISQSAQSQDDWKLVTSEWSEAIALLQAVPRNSPYKALTKSKLTEYQRQLSHAKRQLIRYGGQTSNEVASVPTIITPIQPIKPPSPAPRPNRTATRSTSSFNAPRVFQARIKRRAGGTPVIDVTFNGNQTFEMIVDTGASGTLITQTMAQALNVTPVSEVSVDTASQQGVRLPIGFVDSIAVNGAMVRDVAVAIGGPELDLGLLGHDFFGDYDVTIRRDMVEFRAR